MDLLDQSCGDKLCLKSVLIEYAQESIDPSSLQNMMETICLFYTDFLKSLYNVNSALDLNSKSKNTLMSKLTASLKTRVTQTDGY